jgi:hypothetical protein
MHKHSVTSLELVGHEVARQLVAEGLRPFTQRVTTELESVGQDRPRVAGHATRSRRRLTSSITCVGGVAA